MATPSSPPLEGVVFPPFDKSRLSGLDQRAKDRSNIPGSGITATYGQSESVTAMAASGMQSGVLVC